MDAQKLYRIAVRGLVFNEQGQILLLRRSRPARGEMGYWELPGGGQDHGESPQEALMREVREETGLEVNVGQPLLVWDYCRHANLQIIGITFACSVPKGNVVLSEEHDAYEWIEGQDIEAYKVFPELLEELEILKRQGAIQYVDITE